MKQGNILIIDNEKRMCHVLKVALETDGYNTRLAFDGIEGIEAIQKNDFDAGLSVTERGRAEQANFATSIPEDNNLIAEEEGTGLVTSENGVQSHSDPRTIILAAFH